MGFLDKDNDLYYLKGSSPDLDPLVMEHEIQGSKRYAKFITDVFSERLVFIADYKGATVPIFDGVILDSSGQDIKANYSLKTKFAPMGSSDAINHVLKTSLGDEK